MRGINAALLLLGCSWLTGVRAQEGGPERGRDAAPDLDFLEYLGAWAEGDEEWLAIEELRRDDDADVEDTKDAKDSKDPKDAEEPDTERDDDHESK
ncbi:MAG TPA: hypothetical protein VFL84_02125 [Gammaproteobacteria bacterium]|nr:hypothetical protein [Gammaproteobacteria bacterium]